MLLCLQSASDRPTHQFFDLGKYADAELQYRKSISRNTNLAEGYYRLGLTELELQRADAALELAAYYGDSHREREISQILQMILADRADLPRTASMR